MYVCMRLVIEEEFRESCSVPFFLFLVSKFVGHASSDAQCSPLASPMLSDEQPSGRPNHMYFLARRSVAQVQVVDPCGSILLSSSVCTT